jgi:hypothetical protein
MKFPRLLLLAGIGCLLACPTLLSAKEPPAATGAATGVPSEIVALGQRKAQCRRLMNVEITDEASDARVEKGLSRLRCDAVTADLASLRHKYQRSEAAQKALDAMRDRP